MRGQKAMVVAWIGFAVLGAWLQLAGPDKVLGMDSDSVGLALVLLVALSALHALRTWPRSGFDEAISPGEWRAWGGLFGVAVILFCVIIESGELLGVLGPGDSARIGRRITVLLLIIGTVGWMLDRRWKQRIQSDERDRDISARAAVWGRAALALLVFAVVIVLAGAPAEQLHWATHTAVAHLLVYAIVLGFVVEYGYAVVRYWRDRRA
mgnify:CR=1 FL=1